MPGPRRVLELDVYAEGVHVVGHGNAPGVAEWYHDDTSGVKGTRGEKQSANGRSMARPFAHPAFAGLHAATPTGPSPPPGSAPRRTPVFLTTRLAALHSASAAASPTRRLVTTASNVSTAERPRRSSATM